jgi:hypothetical protein
MMLRQPTVQRAYIIDIVRPYSGSGQSPSATCGLGMATRASETVRLGPTCHQVQVKRVSTQSGRGTNIR